MFPPLSGSVRRGHAGAAEGDDCESSDVPRDL